MISNVKYKYRSSTHHINLLMCVHAGSCCPQVKGQQTDREERSEGSEGKTSSFQQLRLKTISVFTQRERVKLLQCGRDDVTKVSRSKPETLLTDQMFHFLVLLWFDTFTEREEDDRYVFSFLAQAPVIYILLFFCLNTNVEIFKTTNNFKSNTTTSREMSK